MTQQAKILSFDEARRSKRPAHAYRNAQPAPTRTHNLFSEEDSEQFFESLRNDVPDQGLARVSAHTAARYGQRQAGQGRRSSQANGAAQARGASQARRAAQARGASSRSHTAASRSRCSAPSSAGEARKRATESREAKSEQGFFSKLKHDFAKAKADRLFTRDYAGDSSSDASASAPRAALYKGEMGASQRRATRMQENDAFFSGRGQRGSASDFLSRAPKFLRSRWFAVSAAAVFAVVVVSVSIFPQAQQLYHSVRERDQLQAEYAAILERNDSIQATVDALSTNAGVEDRAHEEYGWVASGDNAVTVYGLGVEDTSTTEFTASIVPGSVEAPETWYSQLLDPIFGAN